MASKLGAVDLLHKTLGYVSVKRLQEWVSTGQVKWTHESPPVKFVKYRVPVWRVRWLSRGELPTLGLSGHL